MVEVVQGEAAGVLEVTWVHSESEKIFRLHRLELKGRITIHRESHAQNKTDNNHSFNSHDEVDDNLRTTKPLDYTLHEEVFTGHQSPQQNRRYSHDFTPDASDGLTGPIQSRLGDGLGSKGRPLVLILLDISDLLIIFRESSLALHLCLILNNPAPAEQ